MNIYDISEELRQDVSLDYASISGNKDIINSTLKKIGVDSYLSKSNMIKTIIDFKDETLVNYIEELNSNNIKNKDELLIREIKSDFEKNVRDIEICLNNLKGIV